MKSLNHAMLRNYQQFKIACLGDTRNTDNGAYVTIKRLTKFGDDASRFTYVTICVSSKL